MQIHELPVGSPASGVQFAGDTGSQTQKIDYDALADAILNKLTTKTFDIKSESQTIIAALNALGDASKQDVANNLVTTAAGLVLDARQGKALDDKITTLNSRSDFSVKSVSRSVAVPQGSASSPATVTIDLSSIAPSGKSLYAAIVLLGSYPMPYIGPGASTFTYVSRITNNIITITNGGANWGTTTAFIVAFFK